MAKIDIISGFLGAGKTTLIKKLLQESFKDEKLVLIENEFGEIGIDGGFLKEAGVQVNEMNSGCICCSLVGDFGEALKKVVEDYSPDRVIIEPSGVGKLSDVIKAVQKAQQDVPEAGLELNSATTVVDVSKAKIYIKNFGEFFLNQVEAAGTVVLSRSQNVTEEKLLEAVAMIKEHNAEARIITTPWDDISGDKILEAIEHSTSVEDIMKNFMYDPKEEHHHHHYDENGVCSCGHHHDDDDDEDEHEHHHHHHHEDDEEECCCGHHHHDDDDDEEDEHDHHHHHHYDENGVCSCGHHHHHHADEVFTSWGVETALKFEEEDLKKILDQLSKEEENPYGIILRAKGIVPNKEGKWLEFDLVPGEYEVRFGAPDYTGKLCVIGSKLEEKKIAELFGISK